MTFKATFEFSGMCTLIIKPKEAIVRMLDMEKLGFGRHEAVLVVDKASTLAKVSHDADLVAAVPGRIAEYLVYSLRGASRPITLDRENDTGLKVYDDPIVMDKDPTQQEDDAGNPDSARAESLKWVADIGELVKSKDVQDVPSIDFMFKNGRVSAQGLWEQNKGLTFDFEPQGTWKPNRFLAARFKIEVEFNKYLDVLLNRDRSVMIDGDFAFSVCNTCTCLADQDPDFHAHYKNVRDFTHSTMKPSKPKIDIPPWAPEECFVGYIDLR